MFEEKKLAEITADDIEMYLRQRLKQRRTVKTKGGVIQKGVLKATTVHQELRVIRRMLNVAARKKSCSTRIRVSGWSSRLGSTRWSEKQKIEFAAPKYLRNVVRIITETGLRIYKELIPMKKEQLDLDNRTVWNSDSKTPTGVAEVPLSDSIAISGPGAYLFPNAELKSFKKVWSLTLRRAGVPYFRIYDLRSAYATRLSAGGVIDEFVTQILRQTDAKVFKKYSQMKLQMKREALTKLNRRANEGGMDFGTAAPN